MNKTKNQSTAYSKFLHLVEVSRDLPGFPKLDPLEERLVNQLGGKWHFGEDVTVLEAMKMSKDASAATVHRRLKILRKKGMIKLTVDITDNRVRYIVPTDLTTKYFAKMGQCLNFALQG